MRRFLELYLTGALLLSVAPKTYAITWCHDYAYYVISGGDDSKNSLSADQLRTELDERDYKLIGFLRPSQSSSYLRRGDVLIITEHHSGVVIDDHGHIDHMLMKRDRTYNLATPAKQYTISRALTEYDPRHPPTTQPSGRCWTRSSRKLLPWRPSST